MTVTLLLASLLILLPWPMGTRPSCVEAGREVDARVAPEHTLARLALSS